MKVDLNRRELRLIRLWWLSCEDMMIPNGTCTMCDFKEECEVIRKKLYRTTNDTARPISICTVRT